MDSLPHELYTPQQTRELDRIAIEEFGLSGTILMERAGQAAFTLLRRSWPEARRIVLFCGAGNNGGDGYVIARLARAEGLEVRVFQVGDVERLGGDALAALQRLQGLDVAVEPFESQADLPQCDLLVDALLGTGIRGEVEEPYRQAITAINHAGLPVLAVDVPSGIDATAGTVCGLAVRASRTITFIGMKPGLLTGASLDYCGAVSFDSLSLPSEVYARLSPFARLLEFNGLLQALKPRPRNSHKGLFGHVLVVGGEQGMAGAVRLAGEAALRCGAGVVSIATRQAHAQQVGAGRPELMCYGVEQAEDLQALLARASVLVLGPGLGRGDWSQAMWAACRDAQLPKVVDADALKQLAADPCSREDWILTPHPGEAAGLLDIASADIQADRFAAARQLQDKYGGVAVLKGAGTLVSTHNQVSLCAGGNPGMSSAGMGDVLSGIIGALLGQGLSLVQAAELGVSLHAETADQAVRAAGERGLLASDLLTGLRRLVNAGG